MCVEDAWDEPVYEEHLFCSYCGKDVTNDDGHIGGCGEMIYDEWADKDGGDILDLMGRR